MTFEQHSFITEGREMFGEESNAIWGYRIFMWQRGWEPLPMEAIKATAKRDMVRVRSFVAILFLGVDDWRGFGI